MRSQEKAPAGRGRPWPTSHGISRQNPTAWASRKAVEHVKATTPPPPKLQSYPSPVFGTGFCRRTPCWRSQSCVLSAGASREPAAPTSPKHHLQHRRQQRRKHGGDIKNNVCLLGHLLRCYRRLPKQIPAQRWLGKTGSYFGFSASSTQWKDAPRGGSRRVMLSIRTSGTGHHTFCAMSHRWVQALRELQQHLGCVSCKTGQLRT